jgi:hypothetical protein
MRRVIVTVLVFVGVASLAALAMPRQAFFIRASAAQMQQRIEITSLSMQRGSVGTYATGDVQVRITTIHPDEGHIVIHADEVLYHEDTGEIETHGDARITIEKAQ